MPAATHSVNFGTPGAGAVGSHFMSLDIGGTGTVSLATDVNVDGQFISTPAATPPTLGTTGATHRLTAAGVNVTGLAVNQATFAIGAGTIVAFNNVQFSNMPTTASQLAVNNPGQATPFTFSGLSFATTPTTGFYLNATDSDGGTPFLTITMSGATPAIGAPFVSTSGGAVVNWSAAGGRTWTGATSNWNLASNWNPQVVPTTADDVVIPSGTPNNPTITTSCSAKSLTVNTGATLSLGAFNCQVLGNVVADGAITGTGALQLSTTSQIRGTLPSLIVSGPVTASGTVSATGNLTVTSATGNFIVGGQAVGIGGNLTVQSARDPDDDQRAGCPLGERERAVRGRERAGPDVGRPPRDRRELQPGGDRERGQLPPLRNPSDHPLRGVPDGELRDPW